MLLFSGCKDKIKNTKCKMRNAKIAQNLSSCWKMAIKLVVMWKTALHTTTFRR